MWSSDVRLLRDSTCSNRLSHTARKQNSIEYHNIFTEMHYIIQHICIPI